MRIGYAKLGRSMSLDPAGWSTVGGDNEPPILLNKLARRNPAHEFVIVGRNSGEAPEELGLPSNVINPWHELRGPVATALRQGKGRSDRHQYMSDVLHDATKDLFLSLDGMVAWLGQHGSSNSVIPRVGDPTQTVHPLDSQLLYASFINRGINAWRDEDPHGRQEIWLNPDTRNYLKSRDLKWPPSPIISQYDLEVKCRHWRWGDETTDPADWGATWAKAPNTWEVTHRYYYARLEIVGMPSTLECSYEWEGRESFGMVVNEAKLSSRRVDLIKDWVMPLRPAFICGRWSQESQDELGMKISPVEWHNQFGMLQRVRSTFTTPTSGSGWPTLKVWEAWASGTVMFFHPAYDDQDHLLHDVDPTLRGWLRVDSPEQLARRVDQLNHDKDAWLWLVTEQRKLFDAAMIEQRAIKEIEDRTGLTATNQKEV